MVIEFHKKYVNYFSQAIAFSKKNFGKFTIVVLVDLFLLLTLAMTSGFLFDLMHEKLTYVIELLKSNPAEIMEQPTGALATEILKNYPELNSIFAELFTYFSYLVITFFVIIFISQFFSLQVIRNSFKKKIKFWNFFRNLSITYIISYVVLFLFLILYVQMEGIFVEIPLMFIFSKFLRTVFVLLFFLVLVLLQNSLLLAIKANFLKNLKIINWRKLLHYIGFYLLNIAIFTLICTLLVLLSNLSKPIFFSILVIFIPTYYLYVRIQFLISVSKL